MRIGTVCYATSRGLGHLARDFYLNNIITDICVVRHRGVPTNEEWYPDAPSVDQKNIDKSVTYPFCKEMDAMLFFETPFDWSIIDLCATEKIPTYLVTMYECTPIGHRSPTKYICPSLLDMDYFPKDKSVFLPFPTEYLWKERQVAREFIHNGGYLGMRGREGTTTLIEAMQFVKSPITLTVRVQENVSEHHQKLMAKDKRVEYISKTISYEELYATGDVVVQPQKFNGCSLPLQEACASGMLVMTTNRFPMNTWLPNEPMIPVSSTTKVQLNGSFNKIEESIIKPEDIASTIDFWYEKDITEFSKKGREWAERHSWKALKDKWLEVLT